MFNPFDPFDQITDTNLERYKTAGLIATNTVNEIIKNIVSGQKLFDLYTIGLSFAQNSLKNVYKEVKYKGIAFPLCLSLNNVAGQYVPTVDDKITIKEGDLLKIEIGIHIDGFIGSIGFTTLVVNDTSNAVISDKKTNVLNAVIEASREVYKIMTPKHSNKNVSHVIQEIAKKYKCNLPSYKERGVIPGIFSYQISQYVINGQNEDSDLYTHCLIMPKENPEYNFTLRETPFEEDEVYVIDILMSTGAGKLSMGNRTTIYKRDHDVNTALKLNASKETLKVFNKECFPLTIAHEKNLKVKLGLRECVEKGLIEEYPVVCDKENEYIARIKFTVIVKDDPVLICGRPADDELNKINK